MEYFYKIALLTKGSLEFKTKFCSFAITVFTAVTEENFEIY